MNVGDPIKLTILYYMKQHFKFFFFVNIGLMMAF